MMRTTRRLVVTLSRAAGLLIVTNTGKPQTSARCRTTTRQSWAIYLVLSALVGVGVTVSATPPGRADAAGPMPAWQLPFESGQRWQAGAPHTSGGNGVGARGALDFGPSGSSSRRVVSVAAGTVYRISCAGGSYLGVDHGNGWRSTYYHLTNYQFGLVGRTVSAGTYLGDAGQTVPCGGASTFAHVHLTIFQDGAVANVSGFTFGDYSVYAGGAEYYGFWNDARTGGRVLTVNGAATCCLSSTTRPGPPPGSPIGDVNHVAGMGGGFISVVGWTLDRDAPTTSNSAHVYVDGPAGAGTYVGAIPAHVDRPDVAAAYAGAGAAHGFAHAFGGIAPGRHSVYVYGINIAGGGENSLLGSATIDVPSQPAGSPVGSFDLAAGRVGNAAAIRGWVFDPDAPRAASAVHAYVDGPAGSGARGLNLGAATDRRPDVAEVYPSAGPDHGFNKLVDGLRPGWHSLYVYGINVAGGGENPLLRTLDVHVPGPSPIGHVNQVVGVAGTSSEAGFISVRGWVIDPDVPGTSTSVHAYIDGPAGSGARGVVVPAAVVRPDVASAYPGAGPRHGFAYAIAGIAPGRHTVHVYGIDVGGGGENVLLSAHEVVVPAARRGTPLGWTRSARAVGRGTVEINGWTFDPDTPRAPTAVRAYVDAPAGPGVRLVKLGDAMLRRTDIAQLYPQAGPNHGFVERIDGLSPGFHTLYVYAVNDSGRGHSPLLRSLTVRATR